MGRFKVVATAAAGLLVLSASASHADLAKCQKAIQLEGINLQKQMYSAIQKCADAIRAEEVKGALGNPAPGDTACSGKAGCLVKAAHSCEGFLAKVYDVLAAKPGKSFVNVFRGHIEKARQPTGASLAQVCDDADLAIFTGLQHLTSGGASLSIAPPTSSAAVDLEGKPGGPDGKADPNGGGKFMTDWLLFAIESQTIKQLQDQTPDLLSLFADASTATADIPAAGAKANTSCAPLAPGDTTHEYRPNLCRFGVECKNATCTFDTSGICSGGGSTACDSTETPAQQTTTCGSGNTCLPTKSLVTLESPTIDNYIPIGALPIPIFGALTEEVCRPGPSSGTCYNGGSAGGQSCMQDSDCTAGFCSNNHSLSCNPSGTQAQTNTSCGGTNNTCNSTAPCDMFPGLGAGAAFQDEANVLYLLGGPAKGINAPQPPINISPFNTLVNAVCVDVVSSEGWCDCSNAGLGVKNDAVVCQDHEAPSTGVDACGASSSEAKPDSVFTGTLDGPLHVAVSGGTTPGDCIDLVTLQFKIITNSADAGLDGIPCTDDDTVGPTASFTVPLTSGTATADIEHALYQSGTCSMNGSIQCMQDADCGTSGPCTNQSVADFQLGPVTGAHPSNACAKYKGGNLSGLSLVSAASLLDLELAVVGPNKIPVDGALNFQLTCK